MMALAALLKLVQFTSCRVLQHLCKLIVLPCLKFGKSTTHLLTIS